MDLTALYPVDAGGVKPSTVSRQLSVTAGFFSTCMIDGVLKDSPAEHVRRPAVSAEYPTLSFTHLQLEAMLTAARESANPRLRYPERICLKAWYNLLSGCLQEESTYRTCLAHRG